MIPRTPFVTSALVLLLAGCSSSPPAQPQTVPVEDSPGSEASSAPATTAAQYRVGQQFTLAWKQGEATDTPDEVNLTITVTKFACGAPAATLFEAGKKEYSDDYGMTSEVEVEAGYTPCVANLKVANTGRKKTQHDPVVQAIDADGVEYDADSELTSLIANPITDTNRESFGSSTVSMNPRQTAVTATAFQIPSDTTITQLRYVGGGSVYSDPSIALVSVG